MKTMKSLACSAALALCAATAQAGCAAHVGRTSADPMALVATPSGPSVDTDEGRRVVTTLGTITNPTGVCFTDLVIEVQYFDGAGRRVDTLGYMGRNSPQARALEASLAQGEALRRIAAALERRAGADAAP